jgi:hypothetical protein
MPSSCQSAGNASLLIGFGVPFPNSRILVQFLSEIPAKTALLRKIHALQTPSILVGQLNLFKLQDG